MRFFSYDSRFSQLMIKLCMGCYLNLLWLICSLPIVTVGASTAALYYATLKIVREQEGQSVTALFIKGFKDNLKQATALWLVMLAAGILIGADGYIVYHLRGVSGGVMAVFWTLLLAVIIAAAVVYTIVLMYVFPLTASVRNTNVAMLKNSFFIGTHYLFCTILVFAIHFCMFFVIVRFFTPMLILGEGVCALLSSYLLEPVIAACSYYPDEEDETGDGEESGGQAEDGGRAEDDGQAEDGGRAEDDDQAEDGGRAEDDGQADSGDLAGADDRNESSGRGGSDGAEETGGAGR